MRHRAGLAVLALISALIPAQGAAAEPPTHAKSAPQARLADANGNRLSDSLEHLLENRGPDDAIEVVVTWNGPVDLPMARAKAGPFAVLQEFAIIDGFLARVSPGQARALAKVPGVFRVEENFEVAVNNEEANLDYGTAQARADWGLSGAGIDVCVIDTGVDPNHEQLDNGKVKGFADFINGQTTAYDDHDHGTHVAATIAGDGIGGPNAARYKGVAPAAGIYAAKVLSSGGTGTEAQIISGIEWCADQTPSQVLSMSLGTSTGSDGLDALSQAVNNAVASGHVAAVAAGNSGDGTETVGSPGAAIDALTVGAASKFAGGLHLAPFSSRGPNLNGVLKPDVTAPGVAIVSADANTPAGYFAASGTSMATPFVAGTVALALSRDDTLTPTDVKSLVASTARDLGVAGPDPHWGYGLLDGYAVAAGTGTSPLPAHGGVSANVPDNSTWSHSIEISGDDVGQPLGITILIDGQMQCSLWFIWFCLVWEWSPDLDARLIDPSGAVTNSRCALEGYCGTAGTQETFRVASAVAGTYTLEVHPYTGEPNFGTGGAFVVDIFTGVAGTPSPPVNQAPVANAGPDQTVTDSNGQPGETVTLDGSGSSDPDGTIVSWVWTEGSTPLGSGETLPVSLTDGVHTITLTVTDNDGDTDTDQVVITVQAPPANQAPVANAGPDQTVTDSNGQPGETVTLDGSGSSDSDGTIVSWVWAEGSTPLGNGETLPVVLTDGTHTITLTVTDNDGDTDTDQVVITVQAPATADPGIHVGNIDGTSISLPKGLWYATATVTVHDESENPVGGAMVTFSVSTGETLSCTTDTFGTCTRSSDTVKKRDSSITFTVVAVSGSLTYDQGLNHDPEGDSDGTVLVVQKP